MRRTETLLGCMIVVMLMAGCHESTGGTNGDGEGRYRVSGAFTEDAAQEDLEVLREKLRPYADDLAVMESFPMQYQVNGIQQQDCEIVRTLLQEEPYVASVGDCDAVLNTGDDEGTTSGP